MRNLVETTGLNTNLVVKHESDDTIIWAPDTYGEFTIVSSYDDFFINTRGFIEDPFPLY